MTAFIADMPLVISIYLFNVSRHYLSDLDPSFEMSYLVYLLDVICPFFASQKIAFISIDIIDLKMRFQLWSDEASNCRCQVHPIRQAFK